MLGCGIDLGTSGCRLALVDAAGPIHQLSCPYPGAFRLADSWRLGVQQLFAQLPEQQRQQIGAIAIDGTSGTLLACSTDGEPLAPALAYNDACPEQAQRTRELVPNGGSAASSSGSPIYAGLPGVSPAGRCVAVGLPAAAKSLIPELWMRVRGCFVACHKLEWLDGCDFCLLECLACTAR